MQEGNVFIIMYIYDVYLCSFFDEIFEFAGCTRPHLPILPYVVNGGLGKVWRK